MLGGSALSLWIMGNCASEGSTITRVLRMPHVGRGSRLARGGALAATDLLLCPPNSTCVHVAALRAVSFALLVAVVYVGACVDGCRRSCRRPVSAVGLAADAAVMSATALELPHCPGVPPCRHTFTPLAQLSLVLFPKGSSSSSRIREPPWRHPPLRCRVLQQRGLALPHSTPLRGALIQRALWRSTRWRCMPQCGYFR